MTPDNRGSRSVNWVTGMLLTPSHFLQQDESIDRAVGWLLRYCIPGTGLVGGGVRVESAQQGLARFDPRVEVTDRGGVVRVSVLQARGVTPAGEIVEITEADEVRGEFSGIPSGFTELLVYVTPAGREPDPASVGADDANPSHAAFRRVRYEVRLGAEADVAARSLVVGQLRRASETLGFELDGHFIPACVSVSAHSQLHRGWLTLQSDIVQLAGRFAELHRTVARYVEEVGYRGVDTGPDREILAFIERAVLALDTCAYEILDPGMAPHHLFQQVDRAGRRAAIALDLSSATQLFFQSLSGVDANYGALLEEERQALAERREWSPREDLRYGLERAGQTVTRLRRLGEALEGKYLDYRINRSIGSLRFLLDQDGERFYVAVATPGYPQRAGDILTFTFSEMSLSGQHQYRMVLLGDPQGVSNWQVGEELHVDLRINPIGGRAAPVSRAVPCEIPGQRNFAADFETPPEVSTISSLEVTVQPGHRVRGAILYQRRLGVLAPPEPARAPAARPEAAPPAEPRQPPEPPRPPRPIIKIKD